ncbi:calmodulin-binding protein 60 A isoform X1 [Tanacetum coccineum]
MSQKKLSPPPDQPSSSSPSDAAGHRKRPSFRNVVLEVMNFRKFSKYVEPILEPLVRKVVKEEVQSAMERHIASMNWDYTNDKDISIPRRLQLQFLSNLSLPVFTGTRIEGGDCNTLKVALIDACTGKTVSTGLEASATVEIVVLEGDFDSNEGNDWSLDEFNNNIVRERQGKKPILTGNPLLNLREGIGLVGDLSFRDNSSWTRSRKFRLGARIIDSCDGDRVREAKSESFVVRDHRGELYKKHHPPYLSDEVWRLEKIGKEGAFHKRLNKEKIKTVKDFLALSYLDPTRLRNAEAHKLVISAFQHQEDIVSYDDEYSLRTGTCSISEDIYPLNTQIVTADPESTKLIEIHKKGRFDYPQMSASSPDVMPSIYPTGGINNLDEYGLNSMDFDQPLELHSQVSNTLMCDPEQLKTHDVDEDMRYFGSSSQVDLQCAVDGFLFPHSTIGKAQRRWKIVSSVLKWLSLMLEIRERDYQVHSPGMK